jgi:hypothetical protein
MDVARFLAAVNPAELPPYEFEDRAVGLILDGHAHLDERAGFVGPSLTPRTTRDGAVLHTFMVSLHPALDTVPHGESPHSVATMPHVLLSQRNGPSLLDLSFTFCTATCVIRHSRTLPGCRAGLNLKTGSDEFRPWGHCTATTIVLHYQSHDKLLRRRHQRVVNGGDDMCGEGFMATEICLATEFGKTAHYKCPEGHVFASVAFASWGRVNQFIGPRYPWCKEGPVVNSDF